MAAVNSLSTDSTILKVIRTQYGEYVFISFTEKQEGSEENFITADVCPEYEVKLLPRKKLPGEIAACLFRIEPYFGIDQSSTLGMTELMRQAYRDMQKDKIGAAVTFGAEILLRHFLTDKFVRLSTENIGHVIESWPLSLDSSVDSASVIVIEQAGKSTAEDKPVDIATPIALRFTLHARASRVACYDGCILAGRDLTKWRIRPFKSILSNVEKMSIGIPFSLKLKTMNFYLASDGSSVKYADVYGTGALWTIVTEDVVSGGGVKSQGKYFLRSIETGLFMGAPGTPWQLVPNIADAALITFLSLSEDSDVIEHEDFVKLATSDGKMLGVSKETLAQACLLTISPSTYVSREINYSEVTVAVKESLESIGIFQVVRFEDSPMQMLLYSSYAIECQRHQESLRTEFTNFTSHPHDSEDFEANLREINNLCTALKQSYRQSGAKDRSIFITLRIPSTLADLFVSFNEIKIAVKMAEETLRTLLETTYDNLSELLIQMMETDGLAKKQVKSREKDIINFVNLESKHVPVICKMAYDRIEKGINSRDWIESIRTWMQKMEDVTAGNVVFQDLVLSILSSGLQTLGQTASTIEDIVAVLRERSDTQIFRFKFRVMDNAAYSSLLNTTTRQSMEKLTSTSFTEGDDVFIAMSELLESKGWSSEFAGYIATLIDFYASCYTVLGRPAFEALFPNLSLTSEVLSLMCGDPSCRFRVRTSCFKLLSKMLTVDRSRAAVRCYDEQDVLAFANHFQSSAKELRLCNTSHGQLVLRYFTMKEMPEELAGASLRRVFPFVANFLSFATTIIESGTETELFNDAIQRCVAWALSGSFDLDLKEYSGNWLSAILAQGIREGPHMVQKVNLVITELFSALRASTKTINEVMTKLTLAKFSILHNRGISASSDMNTETIWADLEKMMEVVLLKRATANIPELANVPPLTLLRETLFQSLTAAMRLQFPVTKDVLDLFFRLFAPVQATVSELRSVIYTKFPTDHLQKFREEIKRQTHEVEVIRKLDPTRSNDNLITDCRTEYREILTQLRAIEHSPIKHYAKIIMWEEKLKYYLVLWDRISRHINKPGISEETSIELYRLASALFAIFKTLVENNAKRMKDFLAIFKPFLNCLDLVDEAWLIKEFNNFLNVSPAQMTTFVDILKSRFYGVSVVKSGAFLWVEAMILNSDGSLKKDLQSAAYLSLSTILPAEPSNFVPDGYGSFPLCLRMMALCATRNQSVNTLLSSRVPLMVLKGLLEKTPTADVADAVLTVVARVHVSKTGSSFEAGSQTLIIEILEKVLSVAQSVFSLGDIKSVLREGFYEQVSSRSHINIRGYYFSAGTYQAVSLLRLVSAGMGMGSFGGVTGSIGFILKGFYMNRDTQVEAEMFRNIAGKYRMFLADFTRLMSETENAIQPECDFQRLFAALEKCIRTIDFLLTMDKSLKNPVATVKSSKMQNSFLYTDSSLIPTEDVLLTNPLSEFVAALSRVQSWKDVYVANIANSIKKIVYRRKPNATLLMNTLDEIVLFFQSREKHMFKVMKLVIGAFEQRHLAACNKKVMKLIVGRLLNSRKFEETISAVDFYESYGDLKDPNRYVELQEVLAQRYSGSKLMRKIKHALAAEIRIREVLADSTPRKPKSLTAALRKAKASRFTPYFCFERLVRQHNRLIESYVGLLESWCDNSNIAMQEWAAAQGSPIDVNIVSEVLNFTTELIDLGLQQKTFATNQQTIMYSLDCLCEFISGPCVTNQRTVGESVKLLMIIGEIMKLPFDETFTSESPDEFIDIRSNAFWVLEGLLEGSPSEDLMDVYYRFLNEVPIVKYITLAYSNLIKPKMRELELDLGVSPAHKKIVNFVMVVMSILVRFCNLSDTPLTSMLTIGEPRRAFIQFFSRYIGYVEIYQPKLPDDEPNKLECIHGIWFVIPFVCKFLTSQSASDLIVNVNHTSQQDKLADFLNMVNSLEAEMFHQRKLHNIRGVKAFSMLWNRYQDAATLLVLAITIYILFQFDSVRNTNYSLAADVVIIQVLGVVQVLLYLLGYFAYLIEQYQRIVLKSKSFLPTTEMMAFTHKENHDAISNKYMDLMRDVKKAPKSVWKFVNLVTDYVTVKTLVYIVASVVALVYPLFFPFLLLELAESKPEVRNVFRSITRNWSQLIITSVLGVILVYIFSVFAYVYFADYYSFENGVKSNSLYDCFMSTLNLGIRSGGGIAEALSPPDYEGANSASDTGYNYWGLLVFDICFFVIIIILMLNLIFGIIISTFGELRAARNDLYADINNKCYICGLDRSQIELYGEGWQYHFQIEHSPFAYLAFLISIKELERNKEEMSGIENYVLRKFKSADSTFLPTSSRLIAEKLSGEKY